MLALTSSRRTGRRPVLRGRDEGLLAGEGACDRPGEEQHGGGPQRQDEDVAQPVPGAALPDRLADKTDGGKG
jgi:hypothetical protein